MRLPQHQYAKPLIPGSPTVITLTYPTRATVCACVSILLLPSAMDSLGKCIQRNVLFDLCLIYTCSQVLIRTSGVFPRLKETPENVPKEWILWSHRRLPQIVNVWPCQLRVIMFCLCFQLSPAPIKLTPAGKRPHLDYLTKYVSAFPNVRLQFLHYSLTVTCGPQVVWGCKHPRLEAVYL